MAAMLTASAAAQPQPPGLQFIPVTPCRVADTRYGSGPFGGPKLAAGSSREFDISQSACGIPATAAAYSLNVTVEPDNVLAYLTLWPTGQPQPFLSLLNSDGRIKANAAITAAGTNGGVSIFVTDTTHVILDIDGYFVPAGTASALAFYPVFPCRIADTRYSVSPLGGPSMSGGSTRTFPVQSGNCGIPSTAQAYSMNITALPSSTLRYLTVWPAGETQPDVSTLNALTGTVTANAAIVPAGDNGDISVFVWDDSDVLLDINGYFAPPDDEGLSLYAVTPCLVTDTRGTSGPFGLFAGSLEVDVGASACAPPATAQAYIFNATILPAEVSPPYFQTLSLNYLTLWPAGTIQPGVSTLNAYDGAITSNMAIVPSQNGKINAFASTFSGDIDLILDLSGYFAP